MDRVFAALMGVATRQEQALGIQQRYSIRFRVLRRATNKFHHRNVIGSGGFGTVYLGVLNGTKVAVKRRDKNSPQGAEEFQVEMELLSRLNHPNLVSLIGYCDEKDEMMLVYEYMGGGSLKSHLYGSGKPTLSWEQRLEACVGAAKGLHYLHTSSPTGIIHRDVKSDNILLDGNLCAKIGDFGLSRTGPDELNQTHVITRVMGSFGYMDPQYFQTGQLSTKSDVYSFGVVLLELLCGRPVIDHRLSEEKVSLVTWGQKMLKEGKVEEIVDEKILGTIHPHHLAMFGEIVLSCLAEESAERPTMREVLSNLECELDQCVHAEEEVAAANSDDESNDAFSSQFLQGGGKALRRSEGKNYERYPGVSHHAGLSAPARRPAMKVKDAVELESIVIEDETSSYDSESD